MRLVVGVAVPCADCVRTSRRLLQTTNRNRKQRYCVHYYRTKIGSDGGISPSLSLPVCS